MTDKAKADFDLAAMGRALITGTWGTMPSHEATVCARLQDTFGAAPGSGHWIPPGALLRDLSAGSAAAGGHLAQTNLFGYVPSAQPQSVAVALGARVVPVPHGGSVAIPRGSSSVTTTWLASEVSAATETQPAFSQAAGTLKMLSCYTETSRQLWLQSNVIDVLAIEFGRAASAALDAAVLQGSGASGQPTGIVNTAGIGSFSGTALAVAGLRNAQADISGAVQNRGTVGFVTTPTVAETLAGRQRFAGSSNTLWEGQSLDGTVEGLRAMSTTNCPSAAAIVGDFSTIWVLTWDQLAIEINPYAAFSQGVIGVRLLVPVDIVLTRPGAFSVATSIT